MSEYVNVRVSVCTCVYVCACVYARAHVVYARKSICAYAYVYMFVCVYVCMFANVHPDFYV